MIIRKVKGIIMLGEILEIKNSFVTLKKNADVSSDIINLYVKVIDKKKKYVGEIVSFTKDIIEIKLFGEIVNNTFIHGLNTKPSFNSQVSLLEDSEIKILFGLNNYQPETKLYLGKSTIYENYPIYININNLFANHLVVLGNTGSGKSCGMARIMQNLFYKKDCNPINSTFLSLMLMANIKMPLVVLIILIII